MGLKSFGKNLAVGGIYNAASGGKLMKGGKDLLFGKKDPGSPDRMLELDPSLKKVVDQGRELQSKALSRFGSLLDKDMTGVQTSLAEKQIRQNMQDQQKRAQQLVSRSGLGSSSLGLRAMMEPTRGVQDKLTELRASQPLMQLQNLQNISGGVNSILGTPGAQRALIQGRESMGRQGGLAPLIGAGLGGLLGGPAGAQVGMGLGQASTQMF